MQCKKILHVACIIVSPSDRMPRSDDDDDDDDDADENYPAAMSTIARPRPSPTNYGERTTYLANEFAKRHHRWKTILACIEVYLLVKVILINY